MPDSLEPRELGTLIVVVGKARNLPNKSRFGKQDPFCTLRVGDEKQKTKAIKRGGQHPEWDEELRFTVMEDLEEVLARSESKDGISTSSPSSVNLKDGAQAGVGVVTAAALASKSRKGQAKKTGKKMTVSCYADDAKEPELIGECSVMIEDVLKKGEVDEWYEFLYKDKYSGEVYLELTFYSNDAPPVKRNPSIQKYGQSSVLGSSASSSLSSRPSISSLATSSSVAGMSLYIPPYIQPARTPAPQAMPPSGSFAQLGLPQGHRNSLPNPNDLPTPHSSISSISTLRPVDPIDALTRPLSSTSISSAARPLPTGPPVQSTHHLHPAQRHSIGGAAGEAPWASLLPQSQPAPAPTPLSRPMSATEVSNSHWDLARQAATTPVARPPSQAYPEDRSATPVPPSLMPGGPPAPRPHAHSFSGTSGQPHPSTYLSPATPAPPQPSMSAPPLPNHYATPTSSFPALTQPLPDAYRVSTPQPPPQHMHQQQQQQPPPIPPSQSYDPYRSNTPQPQYPPGDYRAATPVGPGYYGAPAQPSQAEMYHHSAPSQDQGYAQQYHHGYADQQQQQQPPAPQHAPPTPPGPHYQQHQQQMPASSSQWHVPSPPRRQSTPTPPSHQNAVPGPSSHGYVPWYQQTRPASVAPSAPPPVPEYNRPAPPPPAPPKSDVGYYPSDVLYVVQQQQQQAQGAAPWQQHQAPAPYQHDPYRQGTPQPPPIQSYHTPAPYPPAPLAVDTPPRAPAGWQSTVQQQQQHPPAPGHYVPPYPTSTSAPAPMPSTDPYRASPAPPPVPARTPSPMPDRAPAGWHSSISASQTQPQGLTYGQQPQHQQAPYSSPGGVTPSPSMPVTGMGGATPVPGMRQDWKSYMASLSTSGSFPARSPSPQPPAPASAPQQQQDWYTPPPSLPSSIRPPDGWNSGVHTSSDGHQWQR